MPRLAHAAIAALRRCQDWPAVLDLLDQPVDTPIHEIARRAIADQAEPAVVDGLIDRLQRVDHPRRRQQYADLLTRVFKKPGPWVYWGYRPEPRPANPVAWERTNVIAQSLNRVLADPDREVRVAISQRMRREQIPVQLESLNQWLNEERDSKRTDAILNALSQYPAVDVQALLQASHSKTVTMPTENRVKAFADFVRGLDRWGFWTIARTGEPGRRRSGA